MKVGQWKDGRRLLWALPAAVLLLCLIGLFVTRNSMADLSFLADPNAGLVDQKPWQTVQALAPLAVSAEEQNYAQEAERLADHEVDQAFAQALREAAGQVARSLTGEAISQAQKVASLQALVKTDQARVDALTAAARTASGGVAADPNSDDLDVAKTQLQLDTDELADANENLARANGDKRAAIQQELAAHEAAMKKSAGAGGGQTALLSAKSHGTLYARLRAWWDQRGRYALLLQAQRAADNDAAALTLEHDAIGKKATAAATASLQTAASPAPSVSVGTGSNATGSPVTASAPVAAGNPAKLPAAGKPTSRADRLEQLRNLSTVHQILDDRIATQKQLSAVYAKWAAQVQRQHGIVFHLMLRSFALIALIMLMAVLAGSMVEFTLNRPGRRGSLSQPVGQPSQLVLAATERRRKRTLRTILNLAIEATALLLILLVVFGPPSQIPTILGLATAGITVVFQDFILAFFGWFILMGRNGIHVGDWVEINSVGGEVIEIGVFRTALLETGNWTDKGHPTGRRVTFINNFAITGQYFNFSTAGQWMWDEIKVNVPPREDSGKTIEAIHQRVIAETAADTHLAEEEWQRATRQHGLSQFKATPSVDLRPAASGIDIIVRYVTRAGDRFDTRNRLYQEVIDLLQSRPVPALAEEVVEAGR
ncbi:MAG TPA: mechanosensitive ion channel domain-containing protein [Granulicella sp.]|jgi:small-conductance mechanosensitive channel|nr:mechanosensitive ion channel domain-containing protein [Granulicella sp.]